MKTASGFCLGAVEGVEGLGIFANDDDANDRLQATQH